MENISPDDLSREIRRLWEKAGAVASAASQEPPSSAVPAMASGCDIAWEAVALLKSRCLRRERGWAEVLEAREQALRALRERQAGLEKEIDSLRLRAREEEARAGAEALEAGLRLEAAQKALEDERSARERLQEAKSALERTILELLGEARRRGFTIF